MLKKKWAIVKIPYGGGYSSLNIAKPKNVKQAPDALHKEFLRQSIFMSDSGVFSWDNVVWHNMHFEPGRQNTANGWEMMYGSIFSYLNDWKPDKNVLFLGGSHSITASTYYSMAHMSGIKSTGLIILDAHPDCCRKANWPIHSDWLRWMIENEYVLPNNVILIGLRQMEKQEYDFLERFGIKYYPMLKIGDPKVCVTDCLELKLEIERLGLLDATYLSIDIDVVSGVYAPGTGCPSPGGFTDSELINCVKQIKSLLKNLKAVDIVEIDPLNWWRKRIIGYDATVDLGVKLIKEIIS